MGSVSGKQRSNHDCTRHDKQFPYDLPHKITMVRPVHAWNAQKDGRYDETGQGGFGGTRGGIDG